MTLTREPVSATCYKEELLAELSSCSAVYENAQTVLGYHGPVGEIFTRMQATRSRASLLEAMQSLQVDPFLPNSVQRYKRWKAFRHTPISSHVMEVLLLLSNYLLSGIFFITLIVMAASILVPIGLFFWYGALVGLLSSGEYFLYIVLFLIVTFALSQLPTKIIIRTAEWKLVPIECYEAAIPEFVLQTALDIKERCPEAKFFVDELRYKTMFPDPFLVVQSEDGSQFYLEVWNEPGFVQKRMV